AAGPARGAAILRCRLGGQPPGERHVRVAAGPNRGFGGSHPGTPSRTNRRQSVPRTIGRASRDGRTAVGNLGPWEILIIAGAIILLFGARKMPEMARSLGKSARVLKAETTGMRPDAAQDGAAPRGLLG